MASIHPVVAEVTERIAARSHDRRARYLARMHAALDAPAGRTRASCANLAHAFAGSDLEDRPELKAMDRPVVGIVTAYNDMLSAHRPYERYPAFLKAALREVGAIGQVAGGVPAMCDGVTQGRPGMELSLFSREVIAMSVAIALAHDTFDGALMLGICDKIVPGLLMGALAFPHLPVILVPAGPMPSGLPNAEKSRIRQRFAEGLVSREVLLEAEMTAYHGPGTCTFYGTANSNELLLEVMGLHLPGAAFVNPGTPLREALNRAVAHRIAAIARPGDDHRPIGRVVDERTFVNAIVGLHATGGSTNHTLHLVAIARAAGIVLRWQDFADLSEVVPLLARVYPNGSADVNQFHAAGGCAFVIGELLDAGLLHPDVETVWGTGLEVYRQEPGLAEKGGGAGTGSALEWRSGPGQSVDEDILRPAARPFAPNGGLRLLTGNLGQAVMKISAVAPEHRRVSAGARVFESQEAVAAAFEAGTLEGDFVLVLRFQGPRANGMPELHRLTPLLGVLMDRGQRVALLTDGRMSGASGKVPAAIHASPEAAAGGPLSRLRDGDPVLIDAGTGVLETHVRPSEWEARQPARPNTAESEEGLGRELFAAFRRHVTAADEGALANLPD